MLKNNQNAFTLIELLVVISIIGILSSFAIVSLNSARLKARDALRKGDMAQLRTALSLYYDDNLQYPICDGAEWTGNEATDPPFGSALEAGSDCYNTVLSNALTGGARPIMLEVPMDPRNEENEPLSVDPTNGNDTFLYRYISDQFGQQYAIVYYLEEDPATTQFIRGF